MTTCWFTRHPHGQGCRRPSTSRPRESPPGRDTRSSAALREERAECAGWLFEGLADGHRHCHGAVDLALPGRFFESPSALCYLTRHYVAQVGRQRRVAVMRYAAIEDRFVEPARC